MKEKVSVEATGETVGEAKWKALRELERRAPALDKGSVQFQVVSEGERGLLGVGYTPARVVATVEVDATAAAPVARGDESELATRVRMIVERVVGAIGIGAQVDVAETDDELFVTCEGGDLGLLIGRHGQTIDALQHIVNSIVWRSGGEKSVTIDAAGYRDRRRTILEDMADRSAERALQGESVALEPMTPVERKVVHERLKERAGVRTASSGTEPYRYVVIEPDA
ncbi:MAG TPA: RNA-binding cell elongation regulator Jag/EloR [Gaiellaceae bacterium]|nr:RNA-binding cell elongation regulator Jag/EloR [Gaiellaceae bacterium]